MKFWKYHVNGNDFILVSTKEKLDQEKIHLWCKHHFGIGADGVLQVWIEKDKLHYQHFNADGSKASMCGNGIRCVGYWYMEKRCTHRCQVEIEGVNYQLKRYKQFVTLQMPIPEIIENNVYQCGVKHKIVEEYEENKEYNSNLVEYIGTNCFHIVTYELGVGKTYSCGTGNIAAFYHGYKKGKLDKIAIGRNEGGDNLLQYEDTFILISAIVKPIIQGHILL
ncbi:MAG: hypothetical protein K2L08_02540 [Erysipelotrichaceae bacterium]|nr:hypothetical protein [Erysipelotrichaceae bacterium]